MRIIAGEFRSRKIYSPPDDSVTRPMPDRVRESLFSLLRGQCEGAVVVDAFAGTGSIGLEAVSRGAARCVMIERDRTAAAMLRANIDLLGCADRCEIVVGNALGAGALARLPRPLHLAFFDPPYPLVREAVGWTRVKHQFERVIELLDDSGYAILRLPHPFLHEVAADGSPITPAEPDRPRRARPHRPQRFDWRREQEAHARRRPPGNGPENPEDDDGHAAEDDTAPPPAAEPAPGVTRVFPPLTMAGAVGPETHVYRSTAVHLYMRRRQA